MLNVIPTEKDMSTGPREAERVAEGLSDLLSGTYRLVVKTHIYHWNVEGPLFYPIHKMTEEQYQDLFAATDVLAERIRALGQLTPMKITEVLGDHAVSEVGVELSAEDMVADLAKDNERLAHRFHALTKMSEDTNDPVTADLATQRSAVHEKNVWMLRATLGR